MKIAVISSKPYWIDEASPSRCTTDGGFPYQMRILSELFDATRLLLPCLSQNVSRRGNFIVGHKLSVVPLTMPAGSGIWRKIFFPLWLFKNLKTLLQNIFKADAIHALIPGDIGTIGMILALFLQKPLFVRYCGNWYVQETIAEHFWKWFMERFAGGKNVMLVTGEGIKPPSYCNPNIKWIFATTLTEEKLKECFNNRRQLLQTSPRLIIVSRQEKRKGTGVIIESLPLILKDFPQASLDVVGDGKALLGFKKLSELLGIKERVNFYGNVDHEEAISLMQKADIFIFPTTSSEGFPKAVLEALACGLPVVTTKVSVLPHLIGSGCGFLLDQITPHKIAGAVKQILSNIELYQAMSSQAQKTASRYSLERWRDDIRQVLETSWGPLREH